VVGELWEKCKKQYRAVKCKVSISEQGGESCHISFFAEGLSMNIIGRELITQIESCESTGDVDHLIGYLLVALDRAREVERRVNTDLEYHPTVQDKKSMFKSILKRLKI